MRAPNLSHARLTVRMSAHRSTLSLKQLADGADDSEEQALRERIAAKARHASPSPDSLGSGRDDGAGRHASRADDQSDAGSSHSGDDGWTRRRTRRRGPEDGFADAVSSPRSPRSPRYGLNMSGYTVPGRESPRRRRMLRMPAGTAAASACARAGRIQTAHYAGVCVMHRANPGGAGMGERQAASRAAGGPGVGPRVCDCPVAMRLRAGVLTPLGRTAIAHHAGVGMLTIASSLPRQPSKRRRTEKRFFFSSVFGATYVQDAPSDPSPPHAVETRAHELRTERIGVSSRSVHATSRRATQADVFRGTAAHAVEDVLRGINSCVLCYGQTGAGKTYTTFGPDIDW